MPEAFENRDAIPEIEGCSEHTDAMELFGELMTMEGGLRGDLNNMVDQLGMEFGEEELDAVMNDLKEANSDGQFEGCDDVKALQDALGALSAIAEQVEDRASEVFDLYWGTLSDHLIELTGGTGDVQTVQDEHPQIYNAFQRAASLAKTSYVDAALYLKRVLIELDLPYDVEVLKVKTSSRVVKVDSGEALSKSRTNKTLRGRVWQFLPEETKLAINSGRLRPRIGKKVENIVADIRSGRQEKKDEKVAAQKSKRSAQAESVSQTETDPIMSMNQGEKLKNFYQINNLNLLGGGDFAAALFLRTPPAYSSATEILSAMEDSDQALILATLPSLIRRNLSI